MTPSAADPISVERPAGEESRGRTRPLFWSVRRELWEYRSVTRAPLAVAGIAFVGALLGLSRLPGRVRDLGALDAAARHVALVEPIAMAPAPIMLAALLVGFFYSLDALYGERRDRSLLFWKSLPVSDRTAVLAKVSIPLLVLPALAVVLSWGVFSALLLAATAILAASGLDPAVLWAEVNFVEQPIVMLYGLGAHVLWFAPLYAWALLVSAWARRMPLLWATLPPLVLGVIEHHVFGSLVIASFLKERLSGAMREAFVDHASGFFDRVDQLDPIGFLTAPGLWLGLAAAGAFLAGAALLRRRREPS